MKLNFSIILSYIFYRKRDRILPINDTLEPENEGSSIIYDIKEWSRNETSSSYIEESFVEPEDIIRSIIIPINSN
jgi:hypothetical protein